MLGFEGFYEVSDDGLVRSLPRPATAGRVLKPWVTKSGYLTVKLWRENRGVPRGIHILVCEAFHGPRPDGLETRHLDGNQLNNVVGNLCWSTRLENMRDQLRHGTHAQKKQEDLPKGASLHRGEHLPLTER